MTNGLYLLIAPGSWTDSENVVWNVLRMEMPKTIVKTENNFLKSILQIRPLQSIFVTLFAYLELCGFISKELIIIAWVIFQVLMAAEWWSIHSWSLLLCWPCLLWEKNSICGCTSDCETQLLVLLRMLLPLFVHCPPARTLYAFLLATEWKQLMEKSNKH